MITYFLIGVVVIPPAFFFVCMVTALTRSLGGQSRDMEAEAAESRPAIRIVSSR